MKRILFIIALFIASNAWCQATQGRLGIDSASGNVELYHDTIINILPVTKGGTGLTSASSGDLIVGTGANAFSILAHGTTRQRLGWNGSALVWIDTTAGGGGGISGSGVYSRVPYWNGSSSLGSDTSFRFSPTGVTNGVNTHLYRGLHLYPTLTAGANGDTLAAIYASASFVNGAYASVKNYAILADGDIGGTGNLNLSGDNVYASFDAASQRIGFTKKNGQVGSFTFGSSVAFAISQSNATNILPTNTFTQKFAVNSNGTIALNGSNGVSEITNTASVNVASANNIATPDIRFGANVNGISNKRSSIYNASAMGFFANGATCLTLLGDTSVSIGSQTATQSAALAVNSTNKGFLPPRMTTTQRDAMFQGVVSVTISNGGSGYTTGNTVTFSASPYTNASSTPTATGTVVASAGVITSVNITAPGTYTAAPSATASGGTGAILVAVLGPTEGTLIYNTTTHQMNYFNGSSWVAY